jgi:hypothetical protein
MSQNGKGKTISGQKQHSHSQERGFHGVEGPATSTGTLPLSLRPLPKPNPLYADAYVHLFYNHWLLEGTVVGEAFFSSRIFCSVFG